MADISKGLFLSTIPGKSLITISDGLKGYITNTTLSPMEVHRQYNSPRFIENAFRVTKGPFRYDPCFILHPYGLKLT